MGRMILRVITALVVVPMIYFLAALAGGVIPGPHPDFAGAPTHQIGLARGPIHYDLLIGLTPAIRSRYGFARLQGVPVDHKDAEWLILGWGATGFYTTVGEYSDLSAAAVWHGITGDSSVMRVDVAGHIGANKAVRYLRISDAQLAALLDAIDAGFARDANNQPIARTVPGLERTDAFFAGTGRFHLGQTSNVWVGQMLRAAGFDFGIWTATAQSVDLSLRWYQSN